MWLAPATQGSLKLLYGVNPRRLEDIVGMSTGLRWAKKGASWKEGIISNLDMSTQGPEKPWKRPKDELSWHEGQQMCFEWTNVHL